MTPILFFSQETPFAPPAPTLLQAWLTEVSAQEGKQVKQLHIIFCSDPYLHRINKRYLQHDSLTDVITFDYADDPHTLEGDIYISVDTVQANAHTLKVPFTEELCRVIVHGLLHLIGYDDKEASAQRHMRQAEDRSLMMPQAQQWMHMPHINQ